MKHTHYDMHYIMDNKTICHTQDIVKQDKQHCDIYYDTSQ